MATGTLARLVVAVGIDDSQMVSGIARTRASVLSNLAQMGTQAQASVEKTAANITRSNSSTIASMAKPALVGLATIVAIGVGLGVLAVKFESETSHIAASAGITSKSATKIGTDFLAAAGKSQTMIFTAEDMTNSYAAVAGQLALTDSKVNVVSQDMTFMKASVDLAAGSNSSLGAATSGVASILQNFHLKMSDSTLAANTLFNAGQGLHLTIPQVTDAFEKLNGRLGTGLGGLQNTSVLLQDITSHSLSGQRNINLVTGAVNTFLTGAASPAKAAAASDGLKTAELNLAAAQIKLNEAETAGGTSSAAHALAVEKLQVAEDKLAIARATYPAMSKQVVEAELAVQSAQVRTATVSKTNADKVALAEIALQKAHDAVTKAQLVANGMTGNANALLKTLGVTVYNTTTGALEPMANIIGELHDAYSRMTPKVQQYTSATLFGTNAASAMTGIINSGKDAYNKYADSVTKGETAHQAALAATKNLASQWSAVVAQIQSGATTLAIGLEPVISSILHGFSNDLPTIEADATAAFHFIASAVSDAWVVIGPILGFFGSHMIIIEGILALFVLKWAIVKGLKVAEEFASWGAGLAKLVAPSGALNTLQRMFGLGEKGSITQALSDTKNAWNDTFSVAQQVKAQQLGKGVEDATTKVSGMITQLESLGNIKLTAPSDNVDAMINDMKGKLAGAQTELATATTKFVENPMIANALTGNLEKGITNPRILTAVDGIMTNAADAMAGKTTATLGTAVTNALDNTAVTGGDKFATNIASKLGGVIGKVANLASQPVGIMYASAAYYEPFKLMGIGGSGGSSIVNDIEHAIAGAGGGAAATGGAGGIAGVSAAVTEALGGASLGVVAVSAIGAAAIMGGALYIAEKIWGKTLQTNPTGAAGAGGNFGGPGAVNPGSNPAALGTSVDSAGFYNDIWKNLTASFGKSSGGIAADQQAIESLLEGQGLTALQASKDWKDIYVAYEHHKITSVAQLDALLTQLGLQQVAAQQTTQAMQQDASAMQAYSKQIMLQSGGTSNIPWQKLKGLAGGGDVLSNQMYIVGEHGAELFASEQAGSIIPLNTMAKIAAPSLGAPSPTIPGFTPTGAAAGVRQAPVIGVMNVYNPTAEPASQSVEERLRQISYLGQM